MSDSGEGRATIPGYPGYRVSALGRVQSRRHRNGLPSDSWRDIDPQPDQSGYPRVRLYAPEQKPRWRYVHHLVLEAFVGPRPPGMVARHVLTNDPTDCRLVNLAWGTQAENMADKQRHGTTQTADGRATSTTPEQAAAMLAKHAAGEAVAVIAADVGLPYNTVQQAIRRARKRARITADTPAARSGARKRARLGHGMT